ncbi:MAG: glycosyltransferase [Patescibacteria group bacterium]|jgi:glycosyltransferase involved in cell wall biosynthesis
MRKKILYLITQSETGGAQRYVFDLAKNLKEEYDISVAFGPLRWSYGEAGQQSEARKPGKTSELAKTLKNENIPYYIIPHLKRDISPFNDVAAISEIVALLKTIQPEILHLNSSKISILGSLAGLFIKLKIKNCKLKIVYTAHGWVFNEPMSFLKKLFYKWTEKITARFKDKIICVSEFDRQAALKEKIAPPEKLITIHNGIGPINFLSREQARKEIEFRIKNLELRAQNKIIIGSVGNLYKTKGYEYLIEAAKILKEKFLIPRLALGEPRRVNSKFLIFIIGEGKERKKLEALIKKNNLEDMVILAGRIPDAARLLKAFDIYVCSSVKEGLSYTLIEALRAGLPIVATNAGGNPEIIAGAADGALIPVKDAKTLASQIEKFIKDKIPARELSSLRQKNPQEFTLDKMIKKTKEIYNSL